MIQSVSLDLALVSSRYNNPQSNANLVEMVKTTDPKLCIPVIY